MAAGDVKVVGGLLIGVVVGLVVTGIAAGFFTSTGDIGTTAAAIIFILIILTIVVASIALFFAYRSPKRA